MEGTREDVERRRLAGLRLPEGCRLVLTCEACPEQWELFYDDEQIGYLRLRHSRFTVEVPDCGGHVVLLWHYGSHPDCGEFSEEDRPMALTTAVESAIRWRLALNDSSGV